VPVGIFFRGLHQGGCRCAGKAATEVTIFLATDHGDELVRHVMSSIMQQRGVHQRGCPNPYLNASRNRRLPSKLTTMATGAEQAHLFPLHLKRPHHRRTAPPARCRGSRTDPQLLLASTVGQEKKNCEQRPAPPFPLATKAGQEEHRRHQTLHQEVASRPQLIQKNDVPSR
jgi:hypothetical protein